MVFIEENLVENSFEKPGILQQSEPDAHVANETSADNTLGLSRSFLGRGDLEANGSRLVFVGQRGALIFLPASDNINI